MPVDRDHLRRQIIDAFPSQPYHGVVAHHSGCEECESIAASFGGKRWTDIDLATLKQHCYSTCLMTPEAFAYFAPAFMVALLDDPDGDGLGFIPDAFMPSGNRRNCPFTPQQRQTVIRFVDWLSEDYAGEGTKYRTRMMRYWTVSPGDR